MTSNIIKPTDPEPALGSVIMVEGETGTAYQRFYSDGLYHGTNGRVAHYDLIKEHIRRHHEEGGSPVLLIHDTTAL